MSPTVLPCATPQLPPKFKWGISHSSGHIPACRLSFCICRMGMTIPPLSGGYKVKRDPVLCPLQVWGPVYRPTTSDEGEAPASPPRLPGSPWPLQAS